MCTTEHNTTLGPQTAVSVAPPPPVPQVRGFVFESRTFANPLNDSAIATTLLQTNSPSIASAEQFNKQRRFFIYVPKQLATDFANAPAGSKPKANVCLFFGVEPEMTLFGLREFFANETNSVLITIPGVETAVPGFPSEWDGIISAFGFGISTDIINQLMTLAGLDGIDFSVKVMAGYSTGYRGVNQTVINQLVDLSNLTRLIYLDAWYHHDDHPLAASASQYFKKNTKWAIDTALGKSPTANVVIYAFTHPGGVPRSNPSENKSVPNPPREPIPTLITQYPNLIQFIDFEFKFNARPAIDDSLEKICLARLIQMGIGGPVTAPVPAPLLTLINALPDRGSFGTLGLAGFTDLYGWVAGHSAELSGFGIPQAMAIVVPNNLLGNWTDSSHYEMRHREFVLELGKEPLLP
jgi:hypothetical protein